MVFPSYVCSIRNSLKNRTFSTIASFRVSPSPQDDRQGPGGRTSRWTWSGRRSTAPPGSPSSPTPPPRPAPGTADVVGRFVYQ